MGSIVGSGLLLAVPMLYIYGLFIDGDRYAADLLLVCAVGIGVGLVGAGLLGTAQRSTLRKRMALTGPWAGATATGSAASLLVVFGFIYAGWYYRPESVSGHGFWFDAPLFWVLWYAISCAVLGAILGLAQWASIRREVNRAGIWVLANTGSAAAAGSLTFLTFARFPVPFWFRAALAVALGGVVHTAILSRFVIRLSDKHNT